MKRLMLIMTVVAAGLLMGGCEEEHYTYLPDSHWILHVDGMTEGHRLALTFKGDVMRVDDASWRQTPFSDGEWNYCITEDGWLNMWQSESDSDGGSYTVSYDLDYSMSDDGLSLTLVYWPASGGAKTYRFDRR